MKMKHGRPVGFKVGVYGGSTQNTYRTPATNACVFATRSEAHRAGVELLSRWMAPEAFRIIETTKEQVNYRFPKGHARPEALLRSFDVADPTKQEPALDAPFTQYNSNGTGPLGCCRFHHTGGTGARNCNDDNAATATPLPACSFAPATGKEFTQPNPPIDEAVAALQKPADRTTRIAESVYRQACENSMGWCPSCKEFTRDCTEPDAEDYDCPRCDATSVVGAENALLRGLIDLL